MKSLDTLETDFAVNERPQLDWRKCSCANRHSIDLQCQIAKAIADCVREHLERENLAK